MKVIVDYGLRREFAFDTRGAAAAFLYEFMEKNGLPKYVYERPDDEEKEGASLRYLELAVVVGEGGERNVRVKKLRKARRVLACSSATLPSTTRIRST